MIIIRRQSASGIKVGVVYMNLLRHLKEKLVWAIDKQLQIISNIMFLNQAHAWFLRIASVRECLYVCMSVCVRPRGYE